MPSKKKMNIFNYFFFAHLIYWNLKRRRIRDGFKENKNIQDPNKIQVLLKEGNEQLVSLRRQTLLDSLYHSHPPLVVEKRTRWRNIY